VSKYLIEFNPKNTGRSVELFCLDVAGKMHIVPALCANRRFLRPVHQK